MINMRCPNCGTEVNENWAFCPKCGFRLKGDLFTDIFSKIEKEMEEMGKAFERDFEVFDLSPFFRKPISGRGFSIKITGGSGRKPRVSIKTFGDVDKKKIEEEIRKLGFREGPEEAKPEIRELEESKGRRPFIGEVKTTEEPKTAVKRIGDRITVEVELPDVSDERDIEVRSLENSIEVKAVAGDKAYFKILTKPPQTSVKGKYFKNGVLYLELA